MEFNVPVPPSGQYTYYPGTTEIPERSAANTHGVSFKVLAEVELTPESTGRDLRPRVAVRRSCAVRKERPGHLRLQFPRHSAREARCGAGADHGQHISGVEFTKERMGEYHEGIGPLKLYIDDKIVAEEEIRTMTGHFSLCGEGLCIGYDSGDAVSSEYAGRAFDLPGARSRRSCSTLPKMPTSTSRATSRQQWLATDRPGMTTRCANARMAIDLRQCNVW